MGPSSRVRNITGQIRGGDGKGPLKGLKESDLRRSKSSFLGIPPSQQPARPLSPATTVPDLDLHDGSGDSLEEIAPEIVVWTEAMDTMSSDSGSLSPAPEPDPEPELEPEIEPKDQPEHVTYVDEASC